MSDSARAQGLLAPDIFMSAELANQKDSEFCNNIVAFVNRLLFDARLVFDEINEVARSSYLTDQYISQVVNGGHSQYIHNVMHAAEKLGTTQRNFNGIESLLASCILMR